MGVGMATQFPKTQGEFDHQYDHLVEATKRKGRQNKRDEGANDTEIDHDYHVLEGPDNDYDDLDDDHEQDGVYHILDGPTSVEPALNTFQNKPNKVYTGEFLKNAT